MKTTLDFVWELAVRAYCIETGVNFGDRRSLEIVAEAAYSHARAETPYIEHLHDLPSLEASERRDLDEYTLLMDAIVEAVNFLHPLRVVQP